MLLNQQEKKVATILIGAMQQSIMITKGKVGCYHKIEVRKNMARIQKIPQGITLVLSCPVINANRKLQQPNSRRISNGPEPSEINI